MSTIDQLEVTFQEDLVIRQVDDFNSCDSVKQANVRILKNVSNPNSKKKHKDKTQYILEMNDPRIKYNYKQVRDTLHGFVKLSNIAWMIIDTTEFKRLKYLRQLGTTDHVYPAASHSRFEHSIGTYYVANWMLDSLKKNSDTVTINSCLSRVPELEEYYKRTYGENPHNKLDDYVCELVKIAALCHDVGHGPFSHIFDDVTIPAMREELNKNSVEKVEPHSMEVHETRSCYILEYLVKNNKYLSKIFSNDELTFMKNLIDPTKDHRGFIYEIISNSRNGIDVDKLDYLNRDIKTLDMKLGFEYERLINDAKVLNDIICYPMQMYNEVVSLFSTRYLMHKQVYGHKTVISVQYMINDIMMLINPIVKIYEAIFDIDSFCKLTDSYIIETVKFLHQNKDSLNFTDNQKININKAYEIWQNINKRHLYKYIGTIVSKNKIDLNASGFFKDLTKDEVLVHQSKIGYVSGSKKNPLEDLYFYDSKHPNICSKINKEKVSFLIPDTYQEHVCMFFIRDGDNADLKHRVIDTYKNTVFTS
jgi:HD superfamily phosphohydrolase